MFKSPWSQLGLALLMMLVFPLLVFPLLAGPSIDPKYLGALASLEAKQWDKAVTRSQELIRARPDLAAAYKTFIAASRGKKDLTGARAYIESLLVQQPKNARLYYALALCLKEGKQYEAALEKLKEAIELDPGFGEAFVEMADVYNTMNRLDEGIDFLTKYTQRGAHPSNGYLGLGRCYILKSQPDNKRPELNHALRSLTQAISLDYENLAAYRLLALVHFPLEDYEHYLEDCEAIERLAKQKRDDEALYKNVGNLASAYEQRNRRSQAIQRYTEALALAQAAGDQRQQVRYLHLIGTLRTGFVDNREALRSLEEALDLSRQLKKTDPGYGEFFEGWTLVRIGDVYYRLDNRGQAREHYQAALKLHQAIGQEGAAYATKGIGDLEYMIGEYDKAIPLYQDALKIIRALPEAARNRNEDWILSVLGLAYMRKKDYQTALQYYEGALALAEKSKDELRIEEKLGRLGAIFLFTGDLNKALAYLSRARALAEKAEQKEHAGFWAARLGDVYLKLGRRKEARAAYAQARHLGEKVKYSRIIREAAMGQGELLAQEGELKGALRAYDETIQILEHERDQFLLEREKEAFFEDKLDVYERVVNLLLSLYEREHDRHYLLQAFHYAERRKAQGLLQTLPQEQLLRHLTRTSEAYKEWYLRYETEQKPIYQDLLKERARLEVLLAERERLEATIRDGKADENTMRQQKEKDQEIQIQKNKIAALERDRLDRSETSQLQFLNTMRGKFPALAQLYQPQILEADRIQNEFLAPSEVLITYHMQQANTVAFIVGKDQIQVVRMPFGRDHREDLMKKIGQVSSPSGKKEEAFRSLRALYEQVFAPLMPHLKDGSELIIVQDDVLHYVPFAMLALEASGSRPTFLIERYPISYLYSASLLHSQLWAERKKREGPRIDLLAVGDPDFGGELQPLRHTAEEVKNIRRYFQRAAVLLGSAATEAAFKRQAPAARLLHMATHGLLDPETVWHSKIELALSPAIDQKGEDGHLHMYEIFNLDLAADLVVLSACESGLGKFRTGEGLVGISRAFAYAGAPALVVTLWSIPDDRSTAKLMENFYRYMTQGMNKRRALQQAQIDLLQAGYTDPLYWAAFILVGDTSQITIPGEPSSSSHLSILLPVALLLLSATVLLRKLVRRRRRAEVSKSTAIG